MSAIITKHVLGIIIPFVRLPLEEANLEAAKLNFLLKSFYDILLGKKIRERREYRRESAEVKGDNT
jgi:hypothetical protein